jgi:FtsZ-binding cell division protein ZapB
MQLLNAKFSQIATAIETTNAQIAALQAKLSELQEHQQQLLSVEQACQSALAQVGTALSMLNHVDPSEISTFKAAVDAQFGTDLIAFLESAAPETAETVKPVKPVEQKPTAPEPSITEEVEPAIDVEATATDTPTTDEQIKPTPTPSTKIESLLGKMSLADIRKLAKNKKVDARGNLLTIAARLKAIVTESDIWDATT